MSGLDLREMLRCASQRQPRRGGWTQAQRRDAPVPDAADRRDWARRRHWEEGTATATHGGGGGAEREGLMVAPASTGDAAVAGGSATHGGAERVSAGVGDGGTAASRRWRRSMDIRPNPGLAEMYFLAGQPRGSVWRQRAAAAGGRGIAAVRRRGEDEVHDGGGDGTQCEVAPTRTAESAGRNAASVAGQRVACPVVAPDERGNGGGGGGELGTKRGLEQQLASRSQPPKRRAVSAKRQFPAGCGRDAAIPLGRGHDGGVRAPDEATAAAPLAGSRNGLPLDAPPPDRAVLGNVEIGEKVAIADGGVRPSDETIAAAPFAGSRNGLPLDAPTHRAVLGNVEIGEKVAIVDGGVSMANVQQSHVTADAVLMKSSLVFDENRVDCKVSSLDNGAEGAASGTHGGDLLGRKEMLAKAAHLLPKWSIVPATRRFPPGCGRDVVAPLARGEEGNMGSNSEVMLSGVVRDVSHEVVAMDGGTNSVNQCATNIVGALNVGVSDETVQCEELEEGELIDDAYCEVPESQLVAGCVGTSDEIMQDKSLHEGCTDAALETEDGLLIGGNCETIFLAASAKCSVGGPPNETVQAKRVFGDNGIKGKISSLAIDDHGSNTLRSKAPIKSLVQSPLLTLRKMVANNNGSEVDGCISATGIAQVDREVEEGEGALRAYHAVLESQVATSFVPHESTTGRHEGAVLGKIAPEHSIRHFPKVESCRNTSRHVGTIPKAAAESCVEGPSKQHFKGKRDCKNDMIKKSSMDASTKVFDDGNRRSKIFLTARKSVKPPVIANRKPPLNTLHTPFSKGKEESVAASSAFFGPKKRLKVKGSGQSKHIPVKIVSASASASKDNLMDEKASNLEDDDILKELAVHDGKLELHLNVHRQNGCRNTDDRSKIRMLCRRFQKICRALVQAVEQGSLKVRRVDLEADKIIRKLPGFTKPVPIVGDIPGVEVGDEFLYRVELAIVGLHRPYQGGIDTTDHHGELVAISIVASGGYPDELSSSGELIYTGSGGKLAGKEKDEDQKLERGNLALENCIKTRTPVRVIHGFKSQSREDDSHSRARQISTFTYDGLYLVVGCWREGLPGSRAVD
uniref:YDG domain-containing protein n=1 Tax=Leersia perrieri TaxID=77586 RepID=A0A0D9X7N0_9ORYZ